MEIALFPLACHKGQFVNYCIMLALTSVFGFPAKELAHNQAC